LNKQKKGTEYNVTTLQGVGTVVPCQLEETEGKEKRCVLPSKKIKGGGKKEFTAWRESFVQKGKKTGKKQRRALKEK